MAEPAASDYRFWAFISYSSKDEKWARWLHRAIETYGIPAQFHRHATPTGEPAPRRFHPLCRDRDEFRASSALGPQIEEFLRASRFLIVICSPNAAGSPWVNQEIRTFQQLGRGDRIFALIVDGEPHGSEGRECFPEAIRDTEPLAADARPVADGRNNAKLKLLSAMLGVGYDALRQRDDHRRIRRLRSIVAAALLLTMSFGALTWYANRQRAKAVAAREQAESVLEFLVHDIRLDLQALGRVDIAEKVRRRVDVYYAQLGTDISKPRTLHNQAAAFASETQLLIEKGDLAGAWRSASEGRRVAEELVSVDPGRAEWQQDVSIALEQLAVVQMVQGHLAEARAAGEQCRTIQERLVQQDPTNAEWLHRMSSVHSTLGGVQLAQQDSAGAVRSLQAARDIMRRLTAAEPSNTQWRRDYGMTLWKLGDALAQASDNDGALGSYRQSLQNATELAASDPANAAWQRDLWVISSGFGNALLARGDQAGAMRSYLQGLKIGARLMEQDPGNAVWKRDMAVSWDRMGDVLLELDHLEDARDSFRRALEINQRLAGSDWSNADSQRGVFVAYLKLVSVADRMHSADAADWALKAYTQASEMQRRGWLTPDEERRLRETRQKLGEH